MILPFRTLAKGILTLMLLILSTLPASADRFQYGDLYFNTTSENTCEVTFLDENYWENNYDLTEVSIPELAVYKGKSYTVTTIGNYAFSNCSNLTSIDIPSSVTTIGEWAFYVCSSLTSINIPNSVTTIEDWAFAWCSSITSIDISNSVTTIEAGTFSGCSSITSISIPNSVTIIGDEAFSACHSLTSIDIPNSVTTIGDGAFWGCPITTIGIPSRVTTIGNSAFEWCSILTSINVDASNTTYASIDGVLFSKDITTIVAYPAGKANSTYSIPTSVTTIEASAFVSCSSLTSITIPSGVTTIGERAFQECLCLTNINIPTSVTAIGNDAFRNCTSLTSINIPNSVTTIGDGAFDSCSSLTSIDIPNSVTTIESHAFESCKSLTRIDIPNSVTTIGEWAFYVCSSLTSIGIPNSVTRIGNRAFAYCRNLMNIYNYALVPQAIDYDVFYNVPTTATLHVMKGYKHVYEAARYWNDFNIVDDLDNVIPFTFEQEEYHCAVGESFTPSVVGIDADLLEWTSSDSSILYIDPVYHLCLGRKDGIAYITAAQKEHPENSATVRVIVGNVATAIESLTTDDPATEIYTLDGRRANRLANGISIVRTANGKTRKVMTK